MLENQGTKKQLMNLVVIYKKRPKMYIQRGGKTKNEKHERKKKLVFSYFGFYRINLIIAAAPICLLTASGSNTLSATYFPFV